MSVFRFLQRVSVIRPKFLTLVSPYLSGNTSATSWRSWSDGSIIIIIIIIITTTTTKKLIKVTL